MEWKKWAKYGSEKDGKHELGGLWALSEVDSKAKLGGVEQIQMQRASLLPASLCDDCTKHRAHNSAGQTPLLWNKAALNKFVSRFRKEQALERAGASSAQPDLKRRMATWPK